VTSDGIVEPADAEPHFRFHKSPAYACRRSHRSGDTDFIAATPLRLRRTRASQQLAAR
jgi:hypothetical protein